MLINEINLIKDKFVIKNTKIENIDSKIITKTEEIKLIEDRIKNDEIFKNKHIRYELIFRGTRDGRNSSQFHEKCDGIPNTFFVVQTTKGLKFGAYTAEPWKNQGGYIKDHRSFLFSLDLMKIYNHIKGNQAQYFHKDYGPSIYYSIWINQDMFKENSSSVCEQNYAYSGYEKKYELNNEESNFTIKELEIFKIITE